MGLERNQWLGIGIISGMAYLFGKERAEAESFEAEGECNNCGERTTNKSTVERIKKYMNEIQITDDEKNDRLCDECFEEYIGSIRNYWSAESFEAEEYIKLGKENWDLFSLDDGTPNIKTSDIITKKFNDEMDEAMKKVKEGANPDKEAQKLFDKMEKFMERYEDEGASDTEPRDNLVEYIDDVFKENGYKEPEIWIAESFGAEGRSFEVRDLEGNTYTLKQVSDVQLNEMKAFGDDRAYNKNIFFVDGMNGIAFYEGDRASWFGGLDYDEPKTTVIDEEGQKYDMWEKYLMEEIAEEKYMETGRGPYGFDDTNVYMTYFIMFLRDNNDEPINPQQFGFNAESFGAEDDVIICEGCNKERYSDVDFTIDNAREDVLDDGNVLCDYCWAAHDKYVKAWNDAEISCEMCLNTYTEEDHECGSLRAICVGMPEYCGWEQSQGYSTGWACPKCLRELNAESFGGEDIVSAFRGVSCDHDWDNGSYHGGGQMVVTFNCTKCGTHVASYVSDPDEGVVCGDGEIEVCDNCDEPKSTDGWGDCSCGWICTRCNQETDDSPDFCERCDCPECGEDNKNCECKGAESLEVKT